MSDEVNSREMQNQLPDPLQSGGVGTWAPPAAALSLASAIVGLLVFGFLQRNADLRGLFTIALVDNPSLNRFIIVVLAFCAAGLASAIMLRCRHRPGPVLPRIWALMLTGLTLVFALIQLFSPPPDWVPLVDAASVAGFAATLTLSPRLLRLHPDTDWVQRIAPFSLVWVLLLILPSLYFMGGDVIEVWRHGLEGAIDELRTQTEDLGRCSEVAGGCSKQEYSAAFDGLASAVNNLSFRDIPTRFHQDEGMVKRHAELVEAEKTLLDGLVAELPRRLNRQLAADNEGKPDPASSTETLDDFKALWAVALKLGKPEKAKQAYAALLDMLINSPRIPLQEAPVIYTSFVNDGPWDKNLSFDANSRQVVERYQRRKSLFDEMESIIEDNDNPALQTLKTEFRKKYHDGWDKQMLAMKDSWAEHWLLPYFDDHPAKDETSYPWLPLSKVLHMPLIGNIGAADIHELLDLSKQDAEKRVDTHRASNCEKKKRDEKIFSLHCRTYVATAKDKLALRVELRLIYDSRSSTEKPDRVFFFLPVPPGTNLESFAFELENAFPEARQALQQLLKVIDLQKSLQQGDQLQIPPQCPPKSGNSACAEAWEYVKGSGQEYIKLVFYRH